MGELWALHCRRNHLHFDTCWYPATDAEIANLDGATIRWCAEHGGQDAWEVEGNGEVAGYCIAVNYSDDQPLDPGECRMVSVLHILLPTQETPNG